MRRPGVAVIGALLAGTLVACSEPPDPIRPLVAANEGNYTVSAYDEESVRLALRVSADALVTLAREEGSFDVPLDKLNEAVLDVSFVDATRPASSYSGGTEGSSVMTRPRWAVLTMTGERGACWGVRVSGRPSAARLEYTASRSASCRAEEVVEFTKRWHDTWQSPPEGAPQTAPQPGDLPLSQPGRRPGEGPLIPSDAPTTGSGQNGAPPPSAAP